MSKKKVAIVSAMEVEIVYVEKDLSNRQGWKKVTANKFVNEQKQLEVFTSVLGVGKVNAAANTTEILCSYRPDLVVNVGFAGGMHPAAKKGDLTIGSSYVQEDFVPFLDENRPDIEDTPFELVELLKETAQELGFTAYAGRIVTGDYFLNDSKKKNAIIKEFAPVAFDMESAAIGQACTIAHTPFVSIRTFSDNADEHATEQFDESAKESRVPIEERPILLAIHALEKQRELVRYVTTIPDFPKPGIQFRDVTTILKSPEGLGLAIDLLQDTLQGVDYDVIVAPESRGFLFGVPLAVQSHKGFVPVRKPGKLPGATISETYDLEYGTDQLEIHEDSILVGQKVVIVDDLLATGGTVEAIIKLVERLGGEVVQLSFVIELEGLGGREKLGDHNVKSLLLLED